MGGGNMKHSLKKSLATWGTVTMYIMALYGGYKVPASIPQLIGVIATYNAALFGIKKYGPNGHTEEK